MTLLNLCAHASRRIVFVVVVASGIVAEEAVPHLPRFRAILREASVERPERIEVFHRHPIAPEDEFRMEPGFANIQRIAHQQLLAHDRRGEIRAPGEGYLLMPLYQAMGDDGFFLAEAREA